ncbi:hypothetical protein HMI55_003953 [Coelomomyces lativittatus]|nr:hypothetical protein HMI55_003953 [Coelomomyces lativittatus]
MQFYLHTFKKPSLAIPFYHLYSEFTDVYLPNSVTMHVKAIETYAALGNFNHLRHEIKYAMTILSSKQAQTTILSSAILAYCKLKHTDLAMDIFFQMQTYKLIPNLKALSALLQLLLQRHHRPHLLLLSNFISQLLIPMVPESPPALTLDVLLGNLMLKTFFELNQFHQGLTWVESYMKSLKDGHTSCILMEAYFDRNDLDKAKFYFNEAYTAFLHASTPSPPSLSTASTTTTTTLTATVTPNPSSPGHLTSLNSLKSVTHPFHLNQQTTIHTPYSQQVTKEISLPSNEVHSLHPPSSSSDASSPTPSHPFIPWQLYRPFLLAHARKGELDGVLHLLRQLQGSRHVQLDAHVYHVILSQLCQAGHLKQAHTFLMNVRATFQTGCLSSSSTSSSPCILSLFNVYLKALIQHERVEEAWKLFQSLPTRYQVHPDTITYNTLIHGLAQAHRYSDAIHLLHEMPQPTTTTFNSLLVAISKDGDRALFDSLEYQMRKKSIGMDMIGYHAKLSLLLKTKEVDDAMALFKGLEKRNFRIPSTTYALLLQHFLNLSSSRRGPTRSHPGDGSTTLPPQASFLHHVFLSALNSCVLDAKLLPSLVRTHLHFHQFEQGLTLLMTHLHWMSPPLLHLFFKLSFLKTSPVTPASVLQVFHHLMKNPNMQDWITQAHLHDFLNVLATFGDVPILLEVLSHMHSTKRINVTSTLTKSLMDTLGSLHGRGKVQLFEQSVSKLTLGSLNLTSGLRS